MFRVFILQTFLLLTLSIATAAQQALVKPSTVTRIRGSVLSVEDSDRLKIATDDGSITSVTLQGVDAPDENQDYFKKAKKRLSNLVERKDVTVILRTTETGESFAVVYAGADDVGLTLLQEGLAWFAPNRSGSQNKTDRDKYLQAESMAKNAKTGLWDEKDAVAPWTFRGEKIQPIIAEATTTAVPTTTETQHRSQPVPGRTYILGPRGGCYYLNDQGIKVYVKDKTLCQKQ